MAPLDPVPAPSRSCPLVLLALVGLGSCSLPGWTSDPQRVVRGPQPARIAHPVRLTWLAFRPRTAHTQAPGTASLLATSAYARMFEDGHGDLEDVVFDGELWRNAAALRIALGERADLELELAATYASSGFLDRIVREFHHAVGLPQGGAEDRPLFAYEMEITEDGETVYRLEGDRLGLADLPIVWTQRLVDESASSPAIALRAGVELPLGSRVRGFGNGAIDLGAGHLAERSFGRWTATGAADWVSTAGPVDQGAIAARDDFDLQLGVEYRWNDELSLLAGMIYAPGVTRDLGLEESDGEMLELEVGFACELGPDSRLYLSFGEDLISASGPDFTLFAGWSLGW
jgi:hypothetical protein